MSQNGVLQFLSNEEVFESYGSEFHLKEIIENKNSDIEKVASMGQFLLKRFVEQNDEIRSLQSILLGQDEEMKHLKEREKHLNAIDVTYQTAMHDMEIELENMKKVHSDYQTELKRLQRDVVRSNETETSLRKSIFEAARSRKGWTFQQETLKYFPARDYCLLCLNSNDHSSYHKRQTDALYQQLMIARNVCSHMEENIQAEKKGKKMLTDKLLALRKEAVALMQYLQWSGREYTSIILGTPENLPIVPYCENCGNLTDKDVTKTQEIQSNDMHLKLIPEKYAKISEPPVLSRGYICYFDHNLQENQPGKLDNDFKQYESVTMSELDVPNIIHFDSDDDLDEIAKKVQLLCYQQQDDQQEEVEGQIPELEMQMNPVECEFNIQRVSLPYKETENKQYIDDRDMHCSSCMVDGQCQACSAMCGIKLDCLRQLFYCLISFLHTLLRKK